MVLSKPGKYSEFFDAEPIKVNLKSKSIRGGFVNLFGNSFSYILRMASIIVLARILDPEDFGLIAMVMALTVFAARFQDLGLDIPTIQQQGITHQQVSNLFWINTLVGAGLTICVTALSSVIAWFYGDDRLVWITAALSSTFVFSGVVIQHQALLRRQMRFSRLTWIQIVSTAGGIALGLVLALKGFRYWALVWKEVSTGCFAALATFVLCRWKPSFPSAGTGIAKFVRLGRDITGFNIVTFLSQGLDQVFIGRFWGAIPLGLYRQAYQLMMMPITQLIFPINAIIIPALSALQNEPEKYRQYFQKVLSVLSFVYMPVVVYLTVYSDNVVRLILGDKWAESANIFRVFAAGSLIQPIAGIGAIVLITFGRTRRYFWLGTASAVGLTASFVIGVSWGAIGIATAYAVFNYLLFVPSLWFSFKGTPLSISLFMGLISRPLISSLLMGGFLVLIQKNTSSWNMGIQTLLSVLLGSLIYCGIWFFIPGGKADLRSYLSYPVAAFKPVAFSQDQGQP